MIIVPGMNSIVVGCGGDIMMMLILILMLTMSMTVMMVITA